MERRDAYLNFTIFVVSFFIVSAILAADGNPVVHSEAATTDSDVEALTVTIDEVSTNTAATTTATAAAATTSVDSGITEDERSKPPEGKKAKDKRRFSLPTLLEETVTNEVSEKAHEDTEFLCHHYYKDEFVVSAHVTEAGCQLECVLLKSSGQHGGGFFDTSVRKQHNINEGQSCDGENVSSRALPTATVFARTIGEVICRLL